MGKESSEAKTILMGLNGSGYFDLAAYGSYIGEEMTDYVPTGEELEKGFETLVKV